MHGKLFGIGVGPGDPELLTLKAINALEQCSVIAAPQVGERDGTALAIIERYLADKELITCSFAMEPNEEKRVRDRRAVAEQLIEHLDKGKNVGFITLGDPSTYSTYGYVHKIIAERGYLTEVIPGITSFAAAAAALGITLCEGDETLTIIPARRSLDLDTLLSYPGNKVIMKSGKNLEQVLAKLKERGEAEHVGIVSRVTMKDEQLFSTIEAYEQAPAQGYFTLAIVKESE